MVRSKWAMNPKVFENEQIMFYWKQGIHQYWIHCLLYKTHRKFKITFFFNFFYIENVVSCVYYDLRVKKFENNTFLNVLCVLWSTQCVRYWWIPCIFGTRLRPNPTTGSVQVWHDVSYLMSAHLVALCWQSPWLLHWRVPSPAKELICTLSTDCSATRIYK